MFQCSVILSFKVLLSLLYVKDKISWTSKSFVLE
nr:MAG TPA: hypothetical protein [Caudoviricetes sp.]